MRRDGFHDPEEIYRNVLTVVSKLLEGIDANCVVGVGISNQRETTVAWNKITGKPYGNAVVWQCARATKICERESIVLMADAIQKDGNETITVFSGCKAYMDSRK